MISFQPTQRDFILFNLNTYGNEAIQVKSVKYILIKEDIDKSNI